MRLLSISDLPRLADSLRAIVEPAGYSVSHALTVEDAARICAPASAKAVVVHAEMADARLTERVARLCGLGYRPVFVALNSESREWEERALVAGAAFVFHMPWRSGLLLSRLRGIPPQRDAAGGAPLPEAPVLPRGSNPPFGGAEPMAWSANPLLARLHEVAHLFRHASQPDTFAGAYLDRIREALALNRVALYLAPEGAGRALECAYAAGIEPKRWKMATLSLDSGMGRWMAEHVMAISLGTMERYGLEPAIREEMNGLGAQCAIPVQGGDEFMGVLLIGSRVTGYPLTNDEIELVYLLALELGRTLKAGRLNKALAKERQFLSDLTEGLESGCAVFDRDFNVLHVNRKLVQVCGGGAPLEFNFRSLPKALASLAFEVSTGARSNAEIVIRDANDGTHLAKVSLFNPESRAVLVLVDDVSRLTAGHMRELVSLERELVTRLGSQFVHEVRNSLTRLMTLGQLLPDSRDDPAFLDQLQKVLPKDLDRLLRHATLLEILSKPTPEERKLVAVRETIDAAWKAVCADYPGFAPEWLDASGVPQDEAVHVNDEVFRRTCFELLLNGAQSVEDAPSKRLSVSAEAATGSNVRLAFEDAGRGFAPDIIETAISPFVTTRNQGLGLGLTLAEKFARESGGTLSITESKKLGGGAVNVVLPGHG
jgi:nitrogen-specific signal transduction histidine kinase